MESEAECKKKGKVLPVTNTDATWRAFIKKHPDDFNGFWHPNNFIWYERWTGFKYCTGTRSKVRRADHPNESCFKLTFKNMQKDFVKYRGDYALAVSSSLNGEPWFRFRKTGETNYYVCETAGKCFIPPSTTTAPRMQTTQAISGQQTRKMVTTPFSSDQLSGDQLPLTVGLLVGACVFVLAVVLALVLVCFTERGRRLARHCGCQKRSDRLIYFYLFFLLNRD
ncbi:MAG: hypothetical protein AAFO91_07765 [Bacteroidota bacterium]